MNGFGSCHGFLGRTLLVEPKKAAVRHRARSRPHAGLKDRVVGAEVSAKHGAQNCLGSFKRAADDRAMIGHVSGPPERFSALVCDAAQGLLSAPLTTTTAPDQAAVPTRNLGREVCGTHRLLGAGGETAVQTDHHDGRSSHVSSRPSARLPAADWFRSSNSECSRSNAAVASAFVGRSSAR